MILDYYSLRQQPFGVTADPGFLYLSPTHREALASLHYGIQSGRGFMSLIAKPGMGKTTILFQLLDQLKDSARTVYLFQTLCRPEDLLRGLLHDLSVVDDTGDIVHMQDELNRVLLSEARNQRKVIVVIDEAQNLEDSALELVRMLSNFETASNKLMQIVLCGQPQLRDKLASPHLLQLRQRMSIFARLQPFNREDTHLYIEHRLRVAGYNFERPLFTPKAETLIAIYSKGIPRNINNICFNALSLGWVFKQKTIEKEVVREVLDDLDLSNEGAQNLDEKPAARSWTGSKAIPRTGYQQAFAWRKRLAFSAILLLPLTLICTGGRKSVVFHSLPTISAALPSAALPSVASPSEASPDTAEQVTPLFPTDPDSSGVFSDAEPQSLQQAEPAQKAPDGTPREHVKSSSSSVSGKVQPQPRSDSAQTDGPSKLWAEVKSGDSDAEVELARMYLAGVGVPQNCAQAQVLLLTASRKGNQRAADLLNNHEGQCR